MTATETSATTPGAEREGKQPLVPGVDPAIETAPGARVALRPRRVAPSSRALIMGSG